MPHTGSIKDDFKLSKHTGPKSEHDVRQFWQGPGLRRLDSKGETYVQYVTIGTDFLKLCKINLKTHQVTVLHVLTKIHIGQRGNINREII